MPILYSFEITLFTLHESLQNIPNSEIDNASLRSLGVAVKTGSRDTKSLEVFCFLQKKRCKTKIDE